MTTLLLILVLASLEVGDIATLPAELQCFIQHRRSIQTGEIAIAGTMGEIGPYWGTHRFTASEVIWEQSPDPHGNLHGRPFRLPSEDPLAPNFHRTFVDQHGAWSYGIHGAGVASLHETGAGMPHPLAIGAGPGEQLRSLEAIVEILTTRAENWAVQESGGSVRVEADIGERHFQWWIDPSRDCEVIRVRSIMPQTGEIFAETQIELAQWGTLWFPAVVRHYAGDAKTAPVLREFKVTRGEFNKQGHPRKLGPSDIGLEVGTTVEIVRKDGIKDILYWDGKGLVAPDRFRELLKREELSLGPQIAALQAKREQDRQRPDYALRLLRVVDVTPTDEASEWERWVRAYSADQQFDSDQHETALRILRDCQNRAQEYLQRAKPEFAKLDAFRSDLMKSDGVTESDVSEVFERFRRLMAPISALFQEQLKPRVENLRTRDQIRRANTNNNGAG